MGSIRKKRHDEFSTLDTVTNHLNRWYYSEVRDIAQTAIDACRGEEITLERAKYRGHFGVVPYAHRKSAMESFVPYVDTASRERPMGTEPRQWLVEWLDETLDGHEFVIYTYRAKLVAVASDNSDAYESEHGEPSPKPEVTAFHAMRSDVWEVLEGEKDAWDVPDPTDTERLVAKLRNLAIIMVTCEAETIPPEGNILASGDDRADRLAAQVARESIAGGNVWAWGVATVTASYDGLSGSDVLVACSYVSEAKFREDAYFADMVDAALTELAGKILRRGGTAETLEADPDTATKDDEIMLRMSGVTAGIDIPGPTDPV